MKTKHLVTTFAFTFAALFPLLGQANFMMQLKKFNVGKDGVWESKTVVISGPGSDQKPIEQRTCANMAESKKVTDKIKGFSDADKNCDTKVTEDTKESAKAVQTCKMGPVTTKALMTWTRTGENSYKMTQEHFQNGVLGSKTETTSKYVGPCTDKDKPKAGHSAEQEKHCAECKANMTKMKAECNSKSGQEKQMCSSMIPQLEGMCKMSCP